MRFSVEGNFYKNKLENLKECENKKKYEELVKIIERLLICKLKNLLVEKKLVIEQLRGPLNWLRYK